MDIINRSFTTKSISAVTAALLLVTTFTLPLHAEPLKLPAALKSLPSDADAAIVVPSLAELNKKVAMVNQKLALDNPMMSDLLSMAKLMNGVGEGINDNGAAIVTVTNLASAIENDTDPDLTYLIPVNDYDTFIEQLGGEPLEKVTDIIFKQQPAYAKMLEGFAVIGTSKTVVENYQPSGGQAIAQGAGDVGRQIIASSDVMIIFDFKQFGPPLQKMLAEQSEEIEQEMRNEFNADPNNQAPAAIQDLTIAIIKMYIAAADAFLGDTDIMVIGTDITEAGMGISFSAQFKPDTTLSQMVTTGGGAQPLLDKVTEQPYLFATTFSTDGLNMPLMLEKFKQNLPENIDPSFATIIDSYVELIKTTKGTATVQTMPPGGLMAMATGSTSISIVETTDSKAFMAELKNTMKAIGEASIDFGQLPGPDGEMVDFKMTFDVTYTKNALQVAGVEVDQSSLQVNMPPQLMQQMGAGAMFMQQQQNYYFAAVDKDVIIIQGNNAQAINDALEGLKDGPKVGQTAGISSIRTHLTDDPIMEFYIDTKTIVEGVNPLLAMFLNMQPIDVPESLSPIGFSVSVKDHGIVKRAFIPMDVAVFVKDTSMKIQEAQMGGQQPQQHQPGPQPAPF